MDLHPNPKFGPNELTECRNRSKNLINPKKTNFYIEAIPTKNLNFEKNFFFWGPPKNMVKSSKNLRNFKIFKKLIIFQISKKNFQIYRKI